MGHLKHGSAIAYQHRKRAASLPTRLVGMVVGSLNTSGVGWIKSMTPVERHAELVYAESLYERVSLSVLLTVIYNLSSKPHQAIVGIAYSGDWLAFIKEA